MGFLGDLELGKKRPLRVAAYCRISFEEEQQEKGSFKNQKLSLEKEIKEHEGWKLAGVYGDYAISGTQIYGRTDFQRMLHRAEMNSMDYIIAKSIARFSRSAADTLRAIRKLHALGVGVYFIEQGFDSLGEYGEMILACLASIAEMESESISENVRVTLNAMNAKGTPLRKARYGYVKKGYEWEIVPEQAKQVKLAFLMATAGYTFTEIADKLNQYELQERTGREWTCKMVKEALLSEVYAGHIITNKTVVRYGEFGKKQVVNHEREHSWTLSYHHEPIVGDELAEAIRTMIGEKHLPGQEKYEGLQSLREIARLAKKDHLLDEVRNSIPRIPGRYVEMERENCG